MRLNASQLFGAAALVASGASVSVSTPPLPRFGLSNRPQADHPFGIVDRQPMHDRDVQR